MLEGCLKVLFLVAGQALTRIAYGARGSKARKILKGDKLVSGSSVFWSLMLVLLLVSIIIGLATQPFDPYVLIAWIGVPVIYIAYVFYARKKEQQLVQEACKHLGIAEKDFDLWDVEGKFLRSQNKNEQFEMPVAPPPGEWKCSCGRTNANYVTSCVCGQNKNSQKRD